MFRNIIQVVILFTGLGTLYAVLNASYSTEGLKVQQFTSPAPQVQPAVLSSIGAKFNRHLLVLGADGDLHGFPESKMIGVKYWAFYYSGSWCPPSRAFTPRLVQFYNSFKPSHPNFELIFVSDDHSDSDMAGYMVMDSMPWPAVPYSEIGNPDLDAEKYCGPGIPCLVLVDGDGKVLSDSYQNGEYIGPDHVIEDITQMVR